MSRNLRGWQRCCSFAEKAAFIYAEPGCSTDIASFFVFSFVLIGIELDTDNKSAVDAHMVVVKVDLLLKLVRLHLMFLSFGARDPCYAGPGSLFTFGANAEHRNHQPCTCESCTPTTSQYRKSLTDLEWTTTAPE